METYTATRELNLSPFLNFKREKPLPFENEENWADPGFKWFFKRALDGGMEGSEVLSRLYAAALLVAFSPIMLIVYLGIKITMPGPALYRQTRVGKNGNLFEVLKFRSMVLNAEKETGHTLSWEGDPRITAFGRFLRKSHFDELPQLLNVLKGEMAFIGPRPERPEFTVSFEREIPNYKRRHAVKPGITGLAQIACGYDAPAQEKLEYDLTYIAFKDSIVLNLLIAYHTAKKMLFLRSTADILANRAH